MKATQSGPLLLMGAALGGWLLLRGSYVAWTATGGAPPPAIIASLPQSAPPGYAMTPLPLSPILGESGWSGTEATTQRNFAPARRSTAAAAISVARTSSGIAPAMVARPRPTMARVQAELPIRDPRIVAAQSLLLSRMLTPRAVVDGRSAYLGSTFAGRDADRAFVPASRVGANRWSLTAALFVRDGSDGPSLGRSVQLGGTQAYARLGWRPGGGGTEAFARVTSAGRLGNGAEAAIGIAAQPLAAVPVRLVAERRQRIAGEGRSAFAAYAVGGTEIEQGGWRLQAYGATGVVGATRRDAFVEGAATIGRPVTRIGPIELTVGGGAWGAAQPGASRFDIGPTLSVRSDRVDGARLAVDWRQRVSGNAAPPSGPAVTLSVDF
jgi:hypothetical protein